MSDTLIKVESVSKKFCRGLKQSLLYGAGDIAGELLGRPKKSNLRKDEFWSVQDVSFELKRGECLGLIGHNGAGKSTLLKMLNGIIKPDKGHIEMHGRVGALIELNAGFNPILTGRENIYNKGSIIGFTKAEIDRKFDDIVDFSEIGEFLDMPVQNYSSGMKVRLGFAVSAQMEPDVLLIDEVLAVGDVGFRMKCLNAISKMLDNCAVIFVSHSMPYVSRVCTVAMLMENGGVSCHSRVPSLAISKYLDAFGGGDFQEAGNRRAIVTDLTMTSDKGEANKRGTLAIDQGGHLDFAIYLKSDQDIEGICVMLTFISVEMRSVGTCVSKADNFTVPDAAQVVRFHIQSVHLVPGIYTVDIKLLSDSLNEVYYHGANMGTVKVLGERFFGTDVLIPAEWQAV